jgi:predicted transcriptional regulator
MTDKLMIKSAWPEDDIDDLEAEGMITVREYDGEIRITPEGEKALFVIEQLENMARETEKLRPLDE